MAESKNFPDPRIIPGSTPTEGARWVMQNREEAKRRVRTLRKDMQSALGETSGESSASIPSKAYKQNWDAIFGKNENTEKEDL